MNLHRPTVNERHEQSTDDMPSARPALDVDRLSKTFVGQRALDAVSLTVGRGEVHALLGHNGSGKSTLIKILSGFYTPDADSGPVRVDGEPLPWGNPSAAHDAGLRFIHQDLGLVPDLTILENLRLGERYATRRGWRIAWDAERQAARRTMERVGLAADPDARVSSLDPIQKTQLAVARALQAERDAKVLVLDEPTAVLPSAHVDRLLDVVRRTIAEGLGVIYVSHRLEEVFEIADRVTVLRSGRVAGTGPTSEFTGDRLIKLIVGEGASRATPQASARAVAKPTGDAALEFQEVTAGELKGASFAAAPGEILGVAGLAGSGVHDVSRVLLGRTPMEQGTIRVGARALHRCDPHDLLGLGVAVLPSERALRAIAPFTVRENYTLPTLRTFWRRGRLRRSAERRAAQDMIAHYSVLPPEPDRLIQQLSGGNQQKVTLAKWLRSDPAVLVLDEPTQGIDIGAKNDILDTLRAVAARGMAVVYCSSDLFDLTLVCDRVVVMRHGKVAASLAGPELTRDSIITESYRSEAVSARA